MPTDVLTSPGKATAERAALEAGLTGQVLRALRIFLLDVERAAAVAADPAGEPFTLGQVYERWDDFIEGVLAATERAAHLTAAGAPWAPRNKRIITDDLTRAKYLTSMRTRLRAAPLPEAAYQATKEILVRGRAEGWSQRKTIGHLTRALHKDVPADAGTSFEMMARRIARTEATTIFNYTTLTLLADSGATLKKWISHHDNKVRPTHLDADGQVEFLWNPFTVGGFALMVPGDPDAPHHETANCRCVLIGDVEENRLTAAAWEAFYLKSQPRDRRGRWMPKGGMGSPLDAAEIASIESGLFSGQHVRCAPDRIDPLMRDLPNRPLANLELLDVSGAGNGNLFTKHAREIPRDHMPQIPQTEQGMHAFRTALGRHKARLEEVDPRTLTATQNELSSQNVGKLYGKISDKGWQKGSAIFCARNGEILDGHHRWAAACALAATGQPIKIEVLRVDTDIDTLLKIADTVSGERISMTTALAGAGYRSFDEPTSPPPSTDEPWFWFAGEWHLIVTDTGDGVPESLPFNSLTASADDYRYNPSQRRDKRGRWTRMNTVYVGATYEALDSKGKAAVNAKMREYGLTEEALDNEIISRLTPESLAAAKGWYPAAREFNQSVAKANGLTLEQATAITAAVSPQMPWWQNKKRAAFVAAHANDHPELDPLKASYAMGGGMGRETSAAVAIARGADIDSTLTGTKRRSFYNNMLNPGGTQDVTVDRWMMQVGIRAQKDGTQTRVLDKDECTAWLAASRKRTGGVGHVSISDSVRRVAGKLGLPPDEVQAAYWVTVRPAWEEGVSQ